MQELKTKLNKLYRVEFIESIIMGAGMGGLIITVGILLQSKNKITAIYTFVFTVICALAIWRFHIITVKKINPPAPVSFPIGVNTVADLAEQLDAEEIMPDTYFRSASQGNYKTRVLVLYQPAFSGTALKKQRKSAHKKEADPSPVWGTMEEMAHSCRLDICVCDTWSKELEDWVCYRPNIMLSRNESLVRAAVTLQPATLWLAPKIGGAMLNDLKRYILCVNLLDILVPEPGDGKDSPD